MESHRQDLSPTVKNRSVKTKQEIGARARSLYTSSKLTSGAKQTRRICNRDGCTNIVVRGGVCTRHGTKKPCIHKGCTNIAQKQGFCDRHGARQKKPPKICNHGGCTNIVQKGGFCVRHGADVKKCSQEGCTKYAKREEYASGITRRRYN